MSKKYGMSMILAGLMGMVGMGATQRSLKLPNVGIGGRGSLKVPQTKGKRQRSLRSRSNRSKAKRRVK